MHGSSSRARFAVVASAAAVVIALMAPVAASAAAIGSDPSTPATFTVPFSSAATLTAGTMGLPSIYWYWTLVTVAGPRTVEISSTHSPGVTLFVSLAAPSLSANRGIESRRLSSSVDRLRFMAPVSGRYIVVYLGSEECTFTTRAAVIPTQRFILGGQLAHTTVKHGRYIRVSMRLYPRYNSFSSPVRFIVQRRVNGVWKSWTSKTADFGTEYSSYTVFTKRLRFSTPGRYRIRARFRDAVHTTSAYNSWKGLRVY